MEKPMTYINALQTGTARDTFFNTNKPNPAISVKDQRKVAQQVNKIQVEIKSRNVTVLHQYLPHYDEAYGEMKDFEKKINNKEYSQDFINKYNVFLSVGSTSTQGWIRNSDDNYQVIVPATEKILNDYTNLNDTDKKTILNANFMILGAMQGPNVPGITEASNALKLLLKNLRGSNNVICFNAIGYSVGHSINDIKGGICAPESKTPMSGVETITIQKIDQCITNTDNEAKALKDAETASKKSKTDKDLAEAAKVAKVAYHIAISNAMSEDFTTSGAIGPTFIDINNKNKSILYALSMGESGSSVKISIMPRGRGGLCELGGSWADQLARIFGKPMIDIGGGAVYWYNYSNAVSTKVIPQINEKWKPKDIVKENPVRYYEVFKNKFIKALITWNPTNGDVSTLINNLSNEETTIIFDDSLWVASTSSPLKRASEIWRQEVNKQLRDLPEFTYNPNKATIIRNGIYQPAAKLNAHNPPQPRTGFREGFRRRVINPLSKRFIRRSQEAGGAKRKRSSKKRGKVATKKRVNRARVQSKKRKPSTKSRKHKRKRSSKTKKR
jgi:hypothetical protein